MNPFHFVCFKQVRFVSIVLLIDSYSRLFITESTLITTDIVYQIISYDLLPLVHSELLIRNKLNFCLLTQ